MPRKSPNLNANTPLLERIRIGLDLDAVRLAIILDYPVRDVVALCKRSTVSDLGEDDAAYERLLAYVNERVGHYLAVRNTLQKKLFDDRSKRAARRERIKSL